MIKLQKHFLLVLVYIPLIALFAFLERTLVARYWISVPLDNMIPYIKYFVWFYFLWFIYMAAATVYFAVCSKDDFYRLTALMSIGMAVSFIFFVLFPNGQPLRPDDTGGGLSGTVVSWLYGIDTPTNVCPSIHVMNSIAVHVSIVKSAVFSHNRRVKRVSLFVMLMINLATMFIKQHSAVDVIFGILVALALYGLVYGGLFRQGKSSKKHRVR